jgi:hypothetical protein
MLYLLSACCVVQIGHEGTYAYRISSKSPLTYCYLIDSEEHTSAPVVQSYKLAPKAGE